MDIKISSTNVDDVVEFLTGLAEGEIEVIGKGYVNPNSNVKGVYIYIKGDPNQSIDIYLDDTTPKLNSGT